MYTGVVAQMMTRMVSMRFNPNAIKAALISSCDRKTISGAAVGTLTEKEGAGVINALNAINNASLIIAKNSHYETSSSSITMTFYPEESGYISISIAWLREVAMSGSSCVPSDFIDFDLYVYDSDNNLLAVSKSEYNNVELVRIMVDESDYYTIVILRAASGNSTERITLSIGS